MAKHGAEGISLWVLLHMACLACLVQSDCWPCGT
jgi:hypothetical protein